MATQTTTENLDFNKVWLMFQETDRQFKETDRQFKETDRQFKELNERLDKRFQETRELFERQIKETHAEHRLMDKESRDLKELFEKKIVETHAEHRRLDKKSRELEHLFTSKWGELVETLVEGKLIQLLNQRGILVNQTTRRYEAKYNNKNYEFDIIAINGTEVVIVEVKTTLSTKYVKNFIEKMLIIKDILPIFRPFNIVGALAYINHHEQAEIFVQSKGLFTIKATGDSAFITNTEDFKPKCW